MYCITILVRRPSCYTEAKVSTTYGVMIDAHSSHRRFIVSKIRLEIDNFVWLLASVLFIVDFALGEWPAYSRFRAIHREEDCSPVVWRWSRSLEREFLAKKLVAGPIAFLARRGTVPGTMTLLALFGRALVAHYAHVVRLEIICWPWV